MPDTNINLKAKDDASAALQSATDRLKALRSEIDTLRGKGDLSVLDTKNINAMTREAASLERGLGLVKPAADNAGTGITGLFNKFVAAQGGAKNLLFSIGGLVGVAGLAGLASKGLETVLALDKMRSESEQISARFLAQAGSTRNASEALSAMNVTIGNALTNDEKMAASGQLMALGLANSAQSAADLTNIAINLGDKTQGAAQRIEGLTQVMVSGRLVGLKNYGISMQEVNALAAEMQRQTVGLSDIQAKQNAIMAIGTQKLQEYQAAGGEAVTQTEKLTKSWEDYQDALANNVDVGKAKGGAADILRGATIRLQMDATEPLDQIAGLEARLRDLQAVRDDFKQNPFFRAFFGTGVSAQEEIARITAQIAELKGQLGEESRWSAGVERLTGGAQDAEVAVDAIDKAIEGLYAKQEAINVNAVAMAIFRAETDNTTASMLGLGAAIAGAQFARLPNLPDPRAAQGYGAYDAGRKAGSNLRDAQVEVAEIARTNEAALRKVNVAAGRSYQSEMEAAGKAAASKIQGYLSEGMNFSKGLSDLTKQGGMEPGKNGAFEEIYRLQAWLNDGSWAETGMKVAGGDKEKGRKIIQDFQNGIFSADVIGAIDVDALSQQAGMASLAEKSQAAFSKAIAEKSGSSTDIVDNLLGMKANEKGVKPTDTAAANAMNALATAIGATVTGKDFVGVMIGYGETVWGYTEQGMINKAKGSTAFQAAIDAMVAASIAGALQ